MNYKQVIFCLVIVFGSSIVYAEINSTSSSAKSEARSQQSSSSASSNNLVPSYHQTVVRPQSRDGAAHGAAHGATHGVSIGSSYGAPAETSYAAGGYDYSPPPKGQTFHYNLYPSDHHSSDGYGGGSSYGSSSGYGEDEHGGGGDNKKGKKGLLGLLGLLGLGGLGGLPLLLLAIPLLLLLLPLLALIPIPAITVTGGGRKRRESPLGFRDMNLKQRLDYQVNALTDLTYNVLRSEHCFERMACEVSTRAHGSRFDNLLQWFLSMVESTIPKTFQKAIRAYMDSGRMARDGGPVCVRFPCDPLQPFHERFFPAFRRRHTETNEVRRMKATST